QAAETPLAVTVTCASSVRGSLSSLATYARCPDDVATAGLARCERSPLEGSAVRQIILCGVQFVSRACEFVVVAGVASAGSLPAEARANGASFRVVCGRFLRAARAGRARSPCGVGRSRRRARRRAG